MQSRQGQGNPAQVTQQSTNGPTAGNGRAQPGQHLRNMLSAASARGEQAETVTVHRAYRIMEMSQDAHAGSLMDSGGNGGLLGEDSLVLDTPPSLFPTEPNSETANPGVMED